MTSVQLNKRLYTEITRLKLLNKDNAEVKFRLEKSPFSGDDDEDQEAAQKLTEFIVTGQIFPISDIFKERSYLIELKLTRKYPFEPPEVRFLTPIYHPNVGRDGQFCNELLKTSAKWTATTTLVEVIKAVVDHIDHPDIDHSVSVELGREYQDDRTEFNRKALEFVKKHGLPR